MGLIKEHWLETRPSYEVSFVCHSCGDPVTKNVRVALFDGESGDDPEETNVEVECQHCEATWAVDIHSSGGDLHAAIAGHPSIAVDLSEIDGIGEYWENYPEPEPEPHRIFQDAHAEWRLLLGVLSNDQGGASSENRMLLIQLYSILEAYLSDAIVGLALRNTNIQARLISVMPSLKDKTVSLSMVAHNPEIVRDMVKSALQETSFHSLVNVNGMCIAALGRPILPQDKADRDLLLASVELRHDCVHRNGRDKKGKIRTEISQRYLQKLGRGFQVLASVLDDHIREIDFQRQFAMLSDE